MEKIEYLLHLPSEYQLMLASFFVTNPVALQRMKKQWVERDTEHKVRGRTDAQSKEFRNDLLGGAVCLFDPNRVDLGFLAEVNVPTASGLYYPPSEKALYVGSNMYVKKVQRGKVVDTLNNNLFCDVHTIEEGPDKKLLIASTGVDGILLIDPKSPQRVIWDWLATKHGYNRTPDGRRRKIDRGVNYQEVYSITPDHTTHLNTAIFHNGRIYACLFHQGSLVEIDPDTRKHDVVLEGMICPHHIKPREGGYIISNSRANKVLLLDGGFNVTRTIDGDFDWVQDATPLEDNKYLIGDSNNNRFVKVDEHGYKIDELRYEERKMFCFLPIKKQDVVEIFGAS